jgi:hypothetical protein
MNARRVSPAPIGFAGLFLGRQNLNAEYVILVAWEHCPSLVCGAFSWSFFSVVCVLSNNAARGISHLFGRFPSNSES